MKLPVTRLLLLTLLLALPLTACDDGESKPDSGVATLTDNTGVDFRTGKVKDPGSYKDTDLYATSLGASGMKVATGGKNPTDNRPIVWFRNAGGVYRTFGSLDEVPTDRPAGVDHLNNVRQAYGFVLQSVDGDYIRGWAKEVTATSVTIVWDRL